MMYEIERLVTVLKPTQEFLDWLKQLPDQDAALTLEDIRSDCTVLLLPPFETPDDADEYLREHAERILAAECENWCDDESLWPKDLNYLSFTELFDIEHHSMVYDMVDEPFEDEEEEDDEEDFDDENDFDDEDEDALDEAPLEEEDR